jgi:hypothetical protein
MTAQPLALPITADPWGDVRDLEELHAEATRAILAAVAGLKAVAGGMPGSGRPMPLLVLGTAGIGKTHLFARLRRKLGQGAILVHIRPLMSADMTPRYVLGEVFQQLARISAGARQIDTLVGATLAMEWDGGAEEAAGALELLRRVAPGQRAEVLEHLRARLLERMPDLDDGYLEFLLDAPFLDTLALRATLAWLGGHDLSESQKHRIGVDQPLAEDRVVPALRTLARLASRGAPLVVVFDQMENLIQGGQDGRILAYGNLVMDLVDEVRDLVIVQMALESEWMRGIAPVLSLAQKARVMGSSHLLEMPTPEIAERLVRVWMADHPLPAAAFPWPFQAGEIRELARRQATPRMLLQELQQRLGGAALAEPGDSEAAADLLAQAWAEGLQKARADLDDMDLLGQGAAPEMLADGLLHLARLTEGLGLVRSQGPEAIQVGTPHGEVRVAFIHQADGRAVGAALRRLAAVPGARLLVRELWRPFGPNWAATRSKWAALVQQAGVRWHWLERKDAERLLALDRLLKAAVSRDLTGPGGIPFEPEAVTAWMRQAQDPSGWGISRALLGGPAGDADAVPAGEVPAVPVPEVAPPASLGGSAGMPEPISLRVLRRLRVASLDRLGRECRREGQEPGHRELLAQLRSAGAAIVWIGENILCLEEGER